MMTTALATSPTNADTKLASQRITANGSANNHRSWTAMLGLFASQPALAGFELFKKESAVAVSSGQFTASCLLPTAY